MMDLDKENLENLLDNPFVAAIYKRTEPYMGEFLKLDPIVDLAVVDMYAHMRDMCIYVSVCVFFNFCIL